VSNNKFYFEIAEDDGASDKIETIEKNRYNTY
jgi:hypothetical protein